MKDIKAVMPRFNIKLSNTQVKDYFTKVDNLNQNKIGVAEFVKLYHLLGEVEALLPFFQEHAKTKQKAITVQEFKKFMKKEQKASLSDTDVHHVFHAYGTSGNTEMSFAGFLEYLHSQDNSIWNPVHDTLYQDMTKPLAHYFIASSHNT